jgi:predicted alpha/beta-fold hydrolase
MPVPGADCSPPACRQHALLFEGLEYKGFDPKAAASSKDLRTFDDAITRVSFGFKSVDDYYETCSSANKVPDVAIPLLCMQVRHPTSGRSRIPRLPYLSNPLLAPKRTPAGSQALAELTTPPKMDTNCTALSLIPTYW